MIDAGLIAILNFRYWETHFNLANEDLKLFAGNPS
jgi:hypothetical protein